MSERTTSELIETLGDDVDRCHCELIGSIEEGDLDASGHVHADYEFHARQLIRAIFAFVEAVTFSMKVKAAEYCLTHNRDISDAERWFATDTEHLLTDKGNVVERSAHIRPYWESDEAQVVCLWDTAFPDNPPWNEPVEDIRRKLSVQRNLCLVAELKGQIIGTVMAGFDGHRGWMHRLAVASEHRRRGVARALMAEAEWRLAQFGCTKVNLQVRSSNTEVVAFYESIRYCVEDRVSLAKHLGQRDLHAISR